ncbi:MAG: hypothetical protein WCH46_01690 [bacterium]
MRRPQKDIRDKTQFKTSEEFYDKEYGWVRRIADPCPRCHSANTTALLEEQGFTGCTHCLSVQLLEGYAFTEGGYSEARRVLETLFDEKRVDKPVQPPRFMPMFFNRK